MANLHDLIDAARTLTNEERASLIEHLWDTLEPESTAPNMPDWHKTGLDERLAEHVADPDSVVAWEEARQRLTARRRP